MRSNRLLSWTGLALLLTLPACTRVPAESAAPAGSPVASPAPPAGTEPAPPTPPAAVAGIRSTAMATGHLTLSGPYKADAAAEVTCAPAEDALQITLLAKGAPRVILRLDGLAAKGTSGTYKGKVSVIASDLGEGGFRLSEGATEAAVEVVSPGGGPQRVSGSFRTRFKGEAGEGSVAGQFDSCAYTPERP